LPVRQMLRTPDALEPERTIHSRPLS
jgi:hypothetical protein